MPNFEAMLRSRCVDVVHILTPPKTHAELAIRAIEAGCHVFVEKPMALTVEETDAMNAAAGRNGVKLCVGHSRLCAPLMLKARNLVESGKIGKVLHVNVSYNFDVATVLPAPTHSDAKMGGSRAYREAYCSISCPSRFNTASIHQGAAAYMRDGRKQREQYSRRAE